MMFTNCHRCEEAFAVGDLVLLYAYNISITGVCKFK